MLVHQRVHDVLFLFRTTPNLHWLMSYIPSLSPFMVAYLRQNCWHRFWPFFFRSNQMINKTMISEVTPSQPYDHMKAQLFGEIYSWCKMSFFGKKKCKLKGVGLVESRNMKCIFGGLGGGCGVGWVGGEWRQKINCTYRHT